jgi:hypothetical protein
MLKVGTGGSLIPKMLKIGTGGSLVARIFYYNQDRGGSLI